MMPLHSTEEQSKTYGRKSNEETFPKKFFLFDLTNLFVLFIDDGMRQDFQLASSLLQEVDVL